MSDPKPGEIRLWRMRKHLGEWTLRCASLIEAVHIVDSLSSDGWSFDGRIERFGADLLSDDGWQPVPADELEAARNVIEEHIPQGECTFCEGTGLDDRDDGFYRCPVCDADDERIPSAPTQQAIDKENH